MLFFTIAKVALKSLLAHKLRSFLAVLGIIIGVGSVISMLALGAGAEQQVVSRISAMGTDLLIVRPAQRGFRGVASGTQQNLTLADAEALLAEVPQVRQVAPVVQGNSQLKRLGKNARANVLGTSITYFGVRAFEVDRGRAFTEGEVERASRVAVLGPVTATNLFGEEDPIDQTFKIENMAFRVIGVIKSKGDQGWFNPDDQVIVPYTIAMQQLYGLEHLREIDVQMEPKADLAKAQEAITSVLRRRHKLQPGVPDDFEIRNQAEILETFTSVSRTFTMLLGGIASISLLVGGIGIMNIMLVTVTERTREIGVRKAIGAKDRDILRQFLLEAIIMSALGGAVGLLVGIGATFAVERFAGYATAIQPSSVVVALLFSAAVGVFFGYYPARRAAALDPIEALRYE